jgi:hypothetical protein
MGILFLGSCRLAPLAYYFRIYGLSPIYFVDVWKYEKTGMEIDTLVCEPSHQLDLFFESNPPRPDTQIYYVPNLELRMYVHDLIHVFHVDPDYVSLYNAFKASRRKLSQELQQYGYDALDAFIDQNLQTVKLFSSYNHPMPVLRVRLFQGLAEQMNLDLSESLDYLQAFSFVQTDTPLFDLDRDLYQLSFIQETEPRERLGIS